MSGRARAASAPAWFNEGTALEALGRTADAASRYREAIRLDPGYSPAHNNSGALLLRAGRIIEARAAFERAVAADAANADAQANLGLTVLAGGSADEGLTHVRRALEQKPALLPGMTPHVWFLAAHFNPGSRRPAEALALAQQISRVSPDRADALDVLAASQAASGDFTSAVQTAGAALSAAPADRPELHQAILDRIALYRRGRPYVLPR